MTQNALALLETALRDKTDNLHFKVAGLGQLKLTASKIEEDILQLQLEVADIESVIKILKGE